MIKDFAFVAYPVTDMKRARAFYEGVLGLKPDAGFEGGGGAWVEYTVGGGTLSLGSMEGWLPSKDGGNIAFEVDDFDATVENLKKHEIPFTMEPQTFPNCKMAMVRDTEGNAVMVHRRNS
jgi:predicted enzyme related to lactoylglutathione lyase